MDYEPDLKSLMARGYRPVFCEKSGRLKRLDPPEMPLNALEMAIERELCPEEYHYTRETYIELQRSYSMVYESRADDLYAGISERGGDCGDYAARWIKLVRVVNSPKAFILCDWGFWNPPRPGEHLADYASAFAMMQSGIEQVWAIMRSIKLNETNCLQDAAACASMCSGE